MHKTTNPSAKVYVKDNRIFENGTTIKDVEGRQNAGGIVINSGSSEITGVVTLKNNRSTVDVPLDKPYQCFGECSVTSWSSGNLACGVGNEDIIEDPAFTDAGCDQELNLHGAIRASPNHPDSQMPLGVQYTPWLD